MPVIVQGQSGSVVAKKKPVAVSSINATADARLLAEMGDTEFGTLDATKNNQFVAYNSSTDRFNLQTSSDLLVAASSTDLPNIFVTQLEQQLNLAGVLTNLDGGTF